MLIFAVREEKLAVNPADNLRLPKSKPVSPLPYSDADAALLLKAARKETTPALRWAHWIMAFTGMRAGEVLQLTAGDIRNVDGVWCFAIHEDEPGKSVKTGQRRNIPIHPAIEAEGFLKYTASLAGNVPLFPEKRLDQHGNRGGRAWNLVGMWARRVGITDPLKAPDHSWRHRMEDEMRAAGIPEADRDALVGHARRTTGRSYGVRGESLARLKVELSKVSAAFLTL